jgi:cysteine-rich repeat protein
LVVDLGGLHGKEDGSFTLDASNGSAVSMNSGYYYNGTSYSTTKGTTIPLGLVVGQIYEVAMFQAERNQCGSNFGVTLKNFSKPKSICKSVCGDSIVASNEYCDDGKNTSVYNSCGPSCVPAPYCGDAVVQPAYEECDDGLNISQYGGCTPGCKLGPSCGDGRVQAPWEECDDGVNAGGYGKCNSGCHYGERCGDGVVQPAYEECDEGAQNGHGTCLQNCKIDRIY